MADVLIFDDDPSVGDLAAEILRVKGLTVSHFMSGAGAVQLVLENRPKLVVLDIMMPGMDGLTACRTLKSNPSTRGVKIVVLTAKDYGEDREIAIRFGADLFLNKPFDGGLFAREIGKMLGFPDPPAANVMPPAPPVVVTVLGGAAVMQTSSFWAVLDAGRGLNQWVERLAGVHPLVWVLLSRYQPPAISDTAGVARLLSARGRVNVAGPEDSESLLQRLAPAMCASLPGGSRAAPLLYPQREGEFALGPGARAVARYTQHPGHCLAYRIEAQGRAVVWCPAHEAVPELETKNPHEFEKFRALFSEADLVIHGYRRGLTDEPPKDALGRAAWEPVVDLCARSGARHLVLTPMLPQTPIEGVQALAERRAAELGSKMRCSVSRSEERIIL